MITTEIGTPDQTQSPTIDSAPQGVAATQSRLRHMLQSVAGLIKTFGDLAQHMWQNVVGLIETFGDQARRLFQ